MIELSGVWKRYRRFGVWSGVDALRDVSLGIEPGESVGLLGPNGAGKSTLIRLLLGHGRPSGGRIRIDGRAPRDYVERVGIGFVPEAPALPQRWTVHGALRAFAALGELPDEQVDRIEAMVERFGLRPYVDRPIGALSKGIRQRVALAQAFLCERRILLLDEAFQGLDPVWRDRIHELVARWRAESPEHVLLLASHDLEEIERHADRVIALVSGRVRLDRPLAALPAPEEWVVAGADAELGRRVSAARPMEARDGRWTIGQLTKDTRRELGEYLRAGGRLGALAPRRSALETAFRAAVEEAEREDEAP